MKLQGKEYGRTPIAADCLEGVISQQGDSAVVTMNNYNDSRNPSIQSERLSTIDIRMFRVPIQSAAEHDSPLRDDLVPESTLIVKSFCNSNDEPYHIHQFITHSF